MDRQQDVKALQEKTNEEGPSLKIKKAIKFAICLFSGIQAALKTKLWI